MVLPVEGRQFLLKSIKRLNINDLVVEEMLIMLEERKLQPGDRLPGERQLAQDLGVSRHSLREALKKLEVMGLVSIQQGKGTFIREAPSESFSQVLSSMAILGDFSAKEIMEIRECLEIYSVGLAIKRATPSDIEELQARCKAMENNISKDELDTFHDDLNFHLLIVKFTYNQLLWQVVNGLKDILYGIMKILHGDKTIIQRAIMDHKKICSAFEARDVPQGIKYMKRHLGDVENHLVAIQRKGMLE
jgi:GntR family transcriptional repressor for pyruvate dehydrogenase complex